MGKVNNRCSARGTAVLRFPWLLVSRVTETVHFDITLLDDVCYYTIIVL